jgi:hypothetical protein
MDDPRCPRCAAFVSSRAQWCTLCYADLRPAPEPQPEPEPVPDPVPVAELVSSSAAVTAPASPRASARGRHARPAAGAGPVSALPGAPSELDPDLASDPVLAALATDSGPLFSGFSFDLDSIGAKAAVIGIGFVVVAGGMLAVMTVLGLFL